MAKPEWVSWLRANKHDLAPVTGTDFKALSAIDAAWHLYAGSSSRHAYRVLDAIALLVSNMQPSTRHLARELIARAMDWGDRELLWPKVERALAEFEGVRHE